MYCLYGSLLLVQRKQVLCRQNWYEKKFSASGKSVLNFNNNMLVYWSFLNWSKPRPFPFLPSPFISIPLIRCIGFNYGDTSLPPYLRDHYFGQTPNVFHSYNTQKEPRINHGPSSFKVPERSKMSGTLSPVCRG